MYKKGYTNCENVLADFVDSICFTEDNLDHQWTLIYPTIDIADTLVDSNSDLEYREKIFEAIRILRRATIRTVYIPEIKWIDEVETHIVSPANVEVDEFYPHLIVVRTLSPIAKDSPVEVLIKRAHSNLYRNLESKDSIKYAEFYVDYNNSCIYIFKKSVLVRPNEKTIIEINYKTENKKRYDWYVSLFYPENYVNENVQISNTPTLEANKSFICWQYGNEIDNNFYIKPHRNTDCPIFTCFFHQLDLKKYPIGDWLTMEYYISWDNLSVAFMICEEPVVKNPVFGYAYFGIIESLKSVNYNDYKGNFGSFGNRSFDDGNVKVQIPTLGEIVIGTISNKYTINVNTLFYVGRKLVDQKLLFNLIDCETQLNVGDLINIDNPEELISELNVDYIEDFTFDKININTGVTFIDYDIYYISGYQPSMTDLRFQTFGKNTITAQINKNHNMTVLFDSPKPFSISANGYIFKLNDGLYKNKYEPDALSTIIKTISNSSIVDVKFLNIDLGINKTAYESLVEDEFRYLVVKPLNLG